MFCECPIWAGDPIGRILCFAIQYVRSAANELCDFSSSPQPGRGYHPSGGEATGIIYHRLNVQSVLAVVNVFSELLYNRLVYLMMRLTMFGLKGLLEELRSILLHHKAKSTKFPLSQTPIWTFKKFRSTCSIFTFQSTGWLAPEGFNMDGFTLFESFRNN